MSEATKPTTKKSNPFSSSKVQESRRLLGLSTLTTEMSSKLRSVAAVLKDATVSPKLKVVTLPTGDWIADEHVEKARALHTLASDLDQFCSAVLNMLITRDEAKTQVAGLLAQLPDSEQLLAGTLHQLIEALSGTTPGTLHSLLNALRNDAVRLDFGARAIPVMHSRRVPRPGFDQQRDPGAVLGTGSKPAERV